MAKSKIDKTLMKIVDETSKEKSKNFSKDDSLTKKRFLGDPNCPYCEGAGYLRFDVPVGHPKFGRLEICSCRNKDISQKAHERLFALSQLDELSDLTFENFHPRGRVDYSQSQSNSLEAAYNSAREYTKSLDGWLVFQGTYGSGKTHLAAAVANAVVQLGVPTLFLTVPDLLDKLRFAYGSEDTSFEERFEEIRNVKLLIFDDFGTQNTTPWAQEKLFQIINYRYINRLPTVITTNLEIEDIDPRIRSRLKDTQLVRILYLLAPDYRRPLYGVRHHELSSLDQPRLGKLKFSNFSSRQREKLDPKDKKSLKDALDASERFAKKPEKWLILVGSPGSGKTHLAAAIGNKRVELGDSPIFIEAPELLDRLKATFDPTSPVKFDDRFEELRSSSLLILDDLGAQSTTPWAREKLYQLFNYRYNNELPMVITITEDALFYIKKNEPQIHVRMTDKRFCNLITITAPPYPGDD